MKSWALHLEKNYKMMKTTDPFLWVVVRSLEKLEHKPENSTVIWCRIRKTGSQDQNCEYWCLERLNYSQAGPKRAMTWGEKWGWGDFWVGSQQGITLVLLGRPNWIDKAWVYDHRNMNSPALRRSCKAFGCGPEKQEHQFFSLFFLCTLWLTCHGRTRHPHISKHYLKNCGSPPFSFIHNRKM